MNELVEAVLALLELHHQILTDEQKVAFHSLKCQYKEQKLKCTLVPGSEYHGTSSHIEL